MASLIELIQTLRERTGAGMMDCKHALQENDLDIEKSIDWLREKGIAKAAKRSGRTAAEGLSKVVVCDKCGKGVIAEINCETDFVSASDKFHALVDGVMHTLMHEEINSLEDAKAKTEKLFADASIAVGEKLDLRRYTIMTLNDGEGFGSYIHMGGKISCLVLLKKKDDELGNQIAMHITANNPIYISLADVPEEDRARERTIAEADPRIADKPEKVRATIVEKKVDKALSGSCLLLQDFLLDPSKTVGDLLKEKGNEVLKFVRYQVGEGIEKKENPED